MTAKMKTKAFSPLILVLALCIATVVVGVRLVKTDVADPGYQVAQVERRDFTIRVNTVGVLDAARSHVVSSAIRGDKGKIIYLIPDGSRVSRGDVLVRLDPSVFEEEVRRLKGDVAGLEAAVEAASQMLEWEKAQVDREIRKARFNLRIARLDRDKLINGEGPIQLAQYRAEKEKAQEEYRRYDDYITSLKKLQDRGFGNQDEIALAEKTCGELRGKYESARKKFSSYRDYVLPSLSETARAKVENASLELAQTRRASVFKVAKAASLLKEARGRLETAKASLQLARRELGKTTLEAPFDGIAILHEAFRDGQKRKPRVGDRIWQNQPLLYLPDISHMVVKTLVREVDLHRIFIDQPCRVSVDAYPDKSFEGQVSFIGALASRRTRQTGAEKYFQLTISLRGSDSRLRPGMTARTTILTDQVRNALTLPVQAVFEENGQRFVYRQEGTRFHRVRVVVGRRNEDFAEILSGLSTGDRVTLFRPDADHLG
jgi:HlyD family secretion protein